MISLKDRLRYICYKLGKRSTIPASVINSVKIKENGDELINLRKNKVFFFSEKLNETKPEEVLIRKQVYQKLLEVQNLLPKNYYIKIYSAYRPIEEQKQAWERKLEYNKSQYPQKSLKELEAITRSQVANPYLGFGGHQTGGAIDLTLCNKDGIEYDMGTKYSENTDKTPAKSKKIKIEQRKNRDILSTIMEDLGFKNYPNEWWHYSYGDRMWAAYSNKKECFYGLPT